MVISLGCIIKCDVVVGGGLGEYFGVGDCIGEFFGDFCVEELDIWLGILLLLNF